ncbi:MAG: hypothetical protein VX210_02240 [Myxococcota bacterium]|nr:hypothetical protein [Myxococcota bacterium]
MSNDTREITGVHDISGTIYREVGPSFKKVLGTDTDLDGSGVRRIWHRGARKTELLTWEAEDGAIVRQELTFQNLLIETNQTGIVRTGLIPQEGSLNTPQSVEFSSSPDPGVLRKCAMLLAQMEERDAYQHHLLENLNLVLESAGHAAVNVMHNGPHNHDRKHHESLSSTKTPAQPDGGSSEKSRRFAYWIQVAIGFAAAAIMLVLISR